MLSTDSPADTDVAPDERLFDETAIPIARVGFA